MNNSIFVLQINKEPIEFNINYRIKIFKVRTTFIFFIKGKKRCIKNINIFFYSVKKKNNIIRYSKGDYIIVEGFINKKTNIYNKEKIEILALRTHFLF